MLYNKTMDKSTEKSFLRKVYIIIVLILAILALLFYLILSGSAERIQEAISRDDTEPSPSPTAEPIPDETESPDPSADPFPDESASPEPSLEPSADPEAAKDDIQTNESVTKIVSTSLKIDPSYVPEDLVEPDVPRIDDINQSMMRADAAKAMEEMFAAAKDSGYELYLISGYRSYEFQQKLEQYWIERRGEEYAAELDTKPGCSEHQLGLAANIGTVDGICELNACFADSGAYQWLINNSWKYGYIERYPEGSQEITGISYSPWNFRYVGTDAAERIYKSGKTMEEYYSVND